MCQKCQISSRLSRRHFLAFGAAAVAASQRSTPAWAQAPNAIGPDEALKRIIDGNARYAANTASNKDFSAGRAARATAQYPIASIISCADSRVAPELVFDQGPGELFVVRLAGNFVNNDGLASIEYGVNYLGVPLVMVLGHTGCGAVDATIKVLKDNVELPGHIPALVNSIKPAVEAAKKKNPSDLLAEATAENVRYNVQRLNESDPIVSKLVKDGKVKVVGGVYDIATGKVNLL
ncbi:carbonic anhydrase [Microvirga alba]|uniref:carbonic anhydrase n=1 Tax=Microvirga alba TaxID=2791025 RepID=A0A931FR36_9HYPH|nr:carbonic anhydrase [Microvirga alba]MBF9234113.1 carbonic anhydrase [Microvirga alba]